MKLSNAYTTTLDIMLIPNDPGFSFVDARWDMVKMDYPFVAAGADNATGEQRYDDLLDKTEKSLALSSQPLRSHEPDRASSGTPLDYIKTSLGSSFAPAQDRFFAWCDIGLSIR